MFLEELRAPLEAVLFASGEPISDSQLQEILQVDAEKLQELLALLEKELADRQSGLQIRKLAGGWQLVTRQEHFAYVSKLAQVTDRKLSPAAMETLSIIAFKQPITKLEIEKIRGVHIEKTLLRLIELDLIAEVGRKSVIGRPILYGTTKTFLQCFGLNDLNELPSLPELADYTSEAEQLTLINENTFTDTEEEGN